MDERTGDDARRGAVVSQPARTARGTTPHPPLPRTPLVQTTTPPVTSTAAGSSSPRPPVARTPVARTPARSAPVARGSVPRSASGPVHVPRSAPTRRTGPVASGPQLKLVPAATRTPGRATSRSRRRAPFVALIVALLVATTLGLLALNTAIAVDSLKANEQRAANAQQAEEVSRLEQQVVAADTATELARAAAAAGLVQPGAPAHLVLQPDGTSVLLGTAVPAPDPNAPDPNAPAPATPPAAATPPATDGPAPAGTTPTDAAPSGTAPADTATDPAPAGAPTQADPATDPAAPTPGN
ncbi:hypothetical protein O2W14_05550 [Modestobacter sp. VKM Ac-2986]|uniref:hypothetical protein n=1 Tax=Modestobacter sp. VKM Ac-2986 TaxID=3004140 RepID=UPI0022AA320A|nr:hypothetical protein [Modestobacter sp. VKM Ac-2986]MCZ2828297.1 hypothetical protein [Modestobacter sp. VKM Ac-2986]